MVKLLLSQFANPHSKTVANYTAKEMTKSNEIKTLLQDAEEKFLGKFSQYLCCEFSWFCVTDLNICIILSNSILIGPPTTTGFLKKN